MILKNKLSFFSIIALTTGTSGVAGYLIHNNLKEMEKQEKEIDIEKTLKDLQSSVMELIPNINKDNNDLTLQKIQEKLPNIKKKIEDIKNNKNSWKDYSTSISPVIEKYLEIVSRIETKLNKKQKITKK